MRAAAFLLIPLLSASAQNIPPRQVALTKRTVPLLTVEGLHFKDLNRNGRLDPYEDWRLPASARARDLVRRMSIEDLAGLMVHGVLPSADGNPIGIGSSYNFALVEKTISQKHVSSFLTRVSAPPASFAEANNTVQEIAERIDFGVPVTISTDPRSNFLDIPGASDESASFSKWPEMIGLAAVDDPSLVRRFADIVRQEYRAIGIREALSPQADLATEPRWSRINGTFGEDATIAESLVKAYVEGMQDGSTGLHAGSVAAVVKHWAGYGAEPEGLDSHNFYGRYASFPGNNFAYHLIPFRGAFAAHVAAVMPTYSILRGVSIDGKPLEQVGGAFNKQLLSGLLRRDNHFDGVIVSDFLVTADCNRTCREGVPAGRRPDFTNIGMPWGVEKLSVAQRFAKAINAGVDQIGGSDESEVIVSAVKDGLITRSKVDGAAYRILLQKFQLGLFENPYSEPEAAAATVGKEQFVEEGKKAQERSLVLLKNDKQILPYVGNGKKVFLYDIDAKVAAKFGMTVVASPDQADFAIIRATTPSELLHPGYTFGSIFHEGRLDLRAGDPAFEALQRAAASVPTILTIYADRPPILTNVASAASAILLNFGIDDESLLNVIVGKATPQGRLPFELLSTMAEARQQKQDVPHDSPHPLYPYGFGLKYAKKSERLRSGGLAPPP